MALRQVIRIDEELCDGCGECVPGCEEGALQVIDGKARLVSEIYCDGLGACLGRCPTGALTIEDAEAAPFDPAAVEEHLAKLARRELPVASPSPAHAHAGGGCPGSQARTWAAPAVDTDATTPVPSALRQWPVQLHLVPPEAPWFQDADVLLAADCAAFAMGDFHQRYMKGRGLAIACPKLDQGREVYLEKLVTMVREARIRSLTVAIMQVPCCGGLLQLAREAVAKGGRDIPVRVVVIGVQGELLHDAPDEVPAQTSV